MLVTALTKTPTRLSASVIPANIDNQSTIARIKNDKSSEAQRTVDCMFSNIKDAWIGNEIELLYCPTEIMPADGLAKVLRPTRLNLM